MIRVTVRTGTRISADGKPTPRTIGLKLTGHSGLAAAGNDVLCAAVSVLSENLGASLEHLLESPAVINKASGHYEVILPATATSQATELLFASTLLGLQALAQDYPERLTIAEEATE